MQDQTEEEKPHFRDFLIYVAVIILIIVGTVFMFSKNSTSKGKSGSDLKELIDSVNNTVQDVSDSGVKETSVPTDGTRKKYSVPPKMTLDLKKSYSALVTTSMGQIEIKFFTDEAPKTVNNFIFLSKEGFYNGTVFHRIVRDFMIQGGDPLGNGMGDPGYKFDNEKITRDYKRGIVAMANSGPNTNGSQFFIMHKDYSLQKDYVIFAEVTKGMDVIDKIAAVPVEDSGMGEISKPVQEVKIESIQILEK